VEPNNNNNNNTLTLTLYYANVTNFHQSPLVLPQSNAKTNQSINQPTDKSLLKMAKERIQAQEEELESLKGE
jgi:hypothetical protein